jgi:hypothetical protein
VGKQRWWQAGRAVGHPQSTTRYRATQQLANGTACERDENLISCSFHPLVYFSPPSVDYPSLKCTGPTLHCFALNDWNFWYYSFFSLGALSFAEFLREASLRDARGNYCPISGPFYLINGGLIACSVWKCILSASGLLYCEAYFNSDVKLLLWGFCRSQGLLLHSFVYFWYKQRGNSLKYLTGCKDSKHFPLYNIYLLAGYCQQI